MKRDSKLMILTASYGDGHIQVARALKQRFLSQGIGDVQIIDLMKEAHPLLNTVSTSLYAKSTQGSTLGVDYYGWSYYMTRNTKQNGAWNKCFNFLGKKKLQELILQEKPDAIINTFPFGAAPEIGRHLSIPTFTVVTDYALHARWIHPDIHKYYVATEELKDELIDKGLVPAKIEVSGIPIRHTFDNVTAVSKALRKKIDLNKKTILISAGTYGILKHIGNMVQSLIAKGNCQFAVVCGRDRKLENKLNLLYSQHPHVHIFGFIENMHELMAISSCILTKAGALTLTEALTLQLPIFIYKPLAGQEKENAHFFSRKGVAAISQSTEELETQLLHYLSDEAYAQEIRSRMVSLRKEASADFIAKDVLQTIAKEVLQLV
jgi:processive 1,2-diacylglycerol beta-glucosyltransferase